jgi:predicted nucleic acid-binding protein
LIDTSIFIQLERRGNTLRELADRLPDESIAIAAITASELLTGVHRADSEARRLRRESFVEGVLAFVPVLTFDLRTARVHARIWADLAAHGQSIGAHDLLIAATAITHGYAVLTQNIREFGRVPGIEVRGLESE